MTSSSYPVRMINASEFRYECSRRHGDILENGGSIIVTRNTKAFCMIVVIDPNDEDAIQAMYESAEGADKQGKLRLVSYRELRIDIAGTIEREVDPKGVNMITHRNVPFGYIILPKDDDGDPFSYLVSLAHSLQSDDNK